MVTHWGGVHRDLHLIMGFCFPCWWNQYDLAVVHVGQLDQSRRLSNPPLAVVEASDLNCCPRVANHWKDVWSMNVVSTHNEFEEVNSKK
jgi:hypothetical protein